MISDPVWNNESKTEGSCSLQMKLKYHLSLFPRPSRKHRKKQAANKYEELSPNKERSELPECDNKGDFQSGR